MSRPCRWLCSALVLCLASPLLAQDDTPAQRPAVNPGARRGHHPGDLPAQRPSSHRIGPQQRSAAALAAVRAGAV